MGAIYSHWNLTDVLERSFSTEDLKINGGEEILHTGIGRDEYIFMDANEYLSLLFSAVLYSASRMYPFGYLEAIALPHLLLCLKQSRLQLLAVVLFHPRLFEKLVNRDSHYR